MSGVTEKYGFLLRPKWIAFHLLVATGAVVMVALGLWQLGRLDERRAFNEQVRARSEVAAVPIDDLLAEPGFTPDGAAWRSVTAAGTWLPQQVVVFNRSQQGAAGDNIVTALLQDDGTTVLVNRGFVPLGSPAPVPPTGPVEILGTVRPSQERQRGELTDSDLAITEVRRIDVARLAPQFPGEVAPVYVDLVSSSPAVGPDDPVPVPPPELSEGTHLSYAIQWFIFAICVLIGWVFAVRRSIRTRRDESLTDGPGGPAAPGSLPRDVDVASTTTI